MNIIDHILSHIGMADDGLGPYWSPIERVAHNFHMWDLWYRILQEYETEVRNNPPKQVSHYYGSKCFTVIDKF